MLERSVKSMLPLLLAILSCICFFYSFYTKPTNYTFPKSRLLGLQLAFICMASANFFDILVKQIWKEEPYWKTLEKDFPVWTLSHIRFLLDELRHDPRRTPARLQKMQTIVETAFRDMAQDINTATGLQLKFHGFESDLVHMLKETTRLLKAGVVKAPTHVQERTIEDPCTICREEFRVDEHIARLTCKHFYHAECVPEWVALSNTCPLCSTKVQKVDDVHVEKIVGHDKDY